MLYIGGLQFIYTEAISGRKPDTAGYKLRLQLILVRLQLACSQTLARLYQLARGVGVIKVSLEYAWYVTPRLQQSGSTQIVIRSRLDCNQLQHLDCMQTRRALTIVCGLSRELSKCTHVQTAITRKPTCMPQTSIQTVVGLSLSVDQHEIATRLRLDSKKQTTLRLHQLAHAYASLALYVDC